jgi:hypothetical protein
VCDCCPDCEGTGIGDPHTDSSCGTCGGSGDPPRLDDDVELVQIPPENDLEAKLERVAEKVAIANAGIPIPGWYDEPEICEEEQRLIDEDNRRRGFPQEWDY